MLNKNIHLTVCLFQAQNLETSRRRKLYVGMQADMLRDNLRKATKKRDVDELHDAIEKFEAAKLNEDI